MLFAEEPRVLVVDDDSQLRRTLRLSLRTRGFAVLEAAGAGEAMEVIAKDAVDLALLDINMPVVSGLELCRQIRAQGLQIGIVMVTVRDAEKDVVQALEAGADDYIVKPFRSSELTARCQAVLRRTLPSPEIKDTSITAGDLELDLGQRVFRKAGKVVRLTPTEFSLLAVLMKNKGMSMTHTKLLRAVWGPEYGQELEYLRSYIRLLRKKIEVDPTKPTHLVTEPGLGYRFNCPDAHEIPSEQVRNPSSEPS